MLNLRQKMLQGILNRINSHSLVIDRKSSRQKKNITLVTVILNKILKYFVLSYLKQKLADKVETINNFLKDIAYFFNKSNFKTFILKIKRHGKKTFKLL